MNALVSVYQLQKACAPAMQSVRIDIHGPGAISQTGLCCIPAEKEGIFLLYTRGFATAAFYENSVVCFSMYGEDRDTVCIHRLKQTLQDPTRTMIHEDRNGGRSLMPVAAALLAAVTGADLPGTGVNIIFGDDESAVSAIAVPSPEDLKAVYENPSCHYTIRDYANMHRTGSIRAEFEWIHDAVLDFCQHHLGEDDEDDDA